LATYHAAALGEPKTGTFNSPELFKEQLLPTAHRVALLCRCTASRCILRLGVSLLP